MLVSSTLVAFTRARYATVLLALIFAGCAGEPQDDGREMRVAGDETPPSPPMFVELGPLDGVPEYHHEHNRVGDTVSATSMTKQDFADQLDARKTQAADAIDPVKWMANVEALLKPSTVGLIVEFEDDLGSKNGGHTHTALVKVLSQLRGPPIEATSVEIVQSAIESGKINMCDGLGWSSTRPVAVFAEPWGANIYQVVIDHTSGARGWAYKEADGTWSTPQGASLTTETLESVGN
jgi:hypothetical protein